MNSPTEFTNPHVLKEEFVPIHFCGEEPRKIKLLADFSVPLQIVYTMWKNQNYTVESCKTTSLSEKCSPWSKLPPANPLRRTSWKFTQNIQQLRAALHRAAILTQRVANTDVAQALHNLGKRNYRARSEALSIYFQVTQKTLEFSFSVLPNADENVSNQSISLPNKISKTLDVSLHRKKNNMRCSENMQQRGWPLWRKTFGVFIQQINIHRHCYSHSQKFWKTLFS